MFRRKWFWMQIAFAAQDFLTTFAAVAAALWLIGGTP